MTTQRVPVGPLFMLLVAGCGGKSLLPGLDAAAPIDVAAPADVAAPIDTAALDDASSPMLPDGRCISGAFRWDGGTCMCPPATPAVCANRCKDLQNDDDHCGACDVACGPDTICHAGACGPSPTVIQPPRASACASMDLTVSGQTLFWTDEAAGKVLRAPIAGGAPQTIATGEDRPTSIVVLGATAYWLAGAPAVPSAVAQSLRSAPIAGGPVATLVSPIDGLAGFTLSPGGETIYFSTSKTVQKLSALATAAPVVVAQEEKDGVPGVLALDGAHLAYLTKPDGEVRSVELADGKIASCGLTNPDGSASYFMCVRLGGVIDPPFAIVARAGKVYWIQQSFIVTSVIWPAPGNTSALAAQSPTAIAAFALGEKSLFYSAFDFGDAAAATISATGLAPDAPPRRLARAQNGPRSLASDGTHVYWSTADCAILGTSTGE